MQVYTVHIHPGDADPMENAILIREGFNFWAFLLSGLWALYHRLWLGFFAIVAVSLASGLLVRLFNGGPEYRCFANLGSQRIRTAHLGTAQLASPPQTVVSTPSTGSPSYP